MNETRYDVIIAGGGIVGLLAGLLYARSGRRVLVADKKPPPLAAVAAHVPDSRTVALAWRSVELLHDAGLWPSGTGTAIKRVHVSEQGGFAAVRLAASDYDLPALGVVAANKNLEDHLFSLAREEQGIQLGFSTSIAGVSQNDAGVEVQLRNRQTQTTATASLLLAVDGSESPLRDWLGIETRRRDYKQTAIVASVTSSKAHDAIAYERFTAGGPLALLPQNDCEFSIVCTLAADRAQEWLRAPDEDFLALLQSAIGGRVGRLIAVGKRLDFPLSLIEAKKQHSGRTVLLGNAARTLHPVAGQGLNLAIRDVFQLVASATSSSGSIATDPGTPEVIKHFAERRRHDQRRVQRQTDLLARLFVDRHSLLDAPLAIVRQSSLLMLDLATPLRHRFTRDNAGIGIPVDLSAN